MLRNLKEDPTNHLRRVIYNEMDQYVRDWCKQTKSPVPSLANKSVVDIIAGRIATAVAREKDNIWPPVAEESESDIDGILG